MTLSWIGSDSRTTSDENMLQVIGILVVKFRGIRCDFDKKIGVFLRDRKWLRFF